MFNANAITSARELALSCLETLVMKSGRAFLTDNEMGQKCSYADVLTMSDSALAEFTNTAISYNNLYASAVERNEKQCTINFLHGRKLAYDNVLAYMQDADFNAILNDLVLMTVSLDTASI